jgi:uncharacterized membrane protein
MNQRAAGLFFLLAVVTYATDVKPILDQNCIECHDSGADLNLTAFPFVSTTMTSQTAIVQAILGKVGATPPQMPPGNRPKLTADQVSTVQDWLNQGLQP